MYIIDVDVVVIIISGGGVITEDVVLALSLLSLLHASEIR